MTARDDDGPRLLSDADIDELTRALPEQIGRLRAQVRAARSRLSKTAREQAREQDQDHA